MELRGVFWPPALQAVDRTSGAVAFSACKRCHQLGDSPSAVAGQRCSRWRLCLPLRRHKRDGWQQAGSLGRELLVSNWYFCSS